MTEPNKMSDFDLIDNVFSAVANKKAEYGVSSLLAEERNVYLVWAAFGLLENGSFQYFFENDMDAASTAQSFQELGLPIIAECFRSAQSLLPSDFSHLDSNRQFEILQQHETSLDMLAKKVLAEGKQIEFRLADYVKGHPSLSEKRG